MAIIQNQKNGKVVIMDTASNSSITLAGLRVDDSENVVSVSVRQVWYNSNGSWAVARGSNTIMSLFGNGHWNLAGHGVTLTQYSNATIGYTLSGTGTIILELQKSSVANT